MIYPTYKIKMHFVNHYQTTVNAHSENKRKSRFKIIVIN